MDVVSHALVGKLFQVGSRTASCKHKLIVIAFAFLPDLPVFLVYLLLGHEKGRAFWIAHNADWIGVRAVHPVWSAMWEIPHSLFFVALVIVPLVFFLRWPKIAIASYLSHILLDLFTHTGEWGVKPLYPLPYMFDGFTDAWTWPLSYLALSWTALLAVILAVHFCMRTRTSAGSLRVGGPDVE